MEIVRFFHFILMSWVFNKIEIDGAEIKRVVYQSILLSDGYDFVSCYGSCDPSSSVNLQSKFNASVCLGSTITFGCPNSRINVDIRKATLAKLRPDLDMCSHSNSITCKENVLEKIKTICAGLYQCTINVMRDLMFMDCKNVKNPVLEIEYACTIKPTIPSISATKKLLRPASVESRRQTLESTFWLAIAYFTLKDAERVRRSEIQMILVLALSLFIGTVVATCFCFVYCQQAKRKKLKILQKAMEFAERRQNDTLLDSSSCAQNSNHTTENHKQQSIEIIEVRNGAIPKYKIVTQTELSDLNNVELLNYRHDYRISPSELPPSSLLKEYLDKENSKKASSDKDEERSISPSSLPPPPHDLLIDTSSSSSNELLPPPVGFNGDHSIPYLIVTNPSPPGGSTNSLATTSKDVPRDQCQMNFTISADAGDITNYLNNEQENLQNFTQYNRDSNSTGQPSDDYLSSPYMYHPILHHNTPNGKFPSTRSSLTTTSITSNEDTSQDDTNTELKRTRSRKCKDKYGGSLHKSKGFEALRKKGFNNQTLNRLYKKGKTRNSNGVVHHHKTIHSDNEVSNRHIYNHDMKRSCSYYEQTGFTSSLHCISCGNPNEVQLIGPACYPRLTREFDDSQSSQTTNEEVKKLRFIEESGYQTHDTGSDSLCSSPFSTDQEDSRMFMPAYMTPTYCTDVCRSCEDNEPSQVESNNNNTTSDVSRASVDVPRKLMTSKRKKYRRNIQRAGLTDIDEKCSQRNFVAKNGTGGFETT